jgi:hypothetical protein
MCEDRHRGARHQSADVATVYAVGRDWLSRKATRRIAGRPIAGVLGLVEGCQLVGKLIAQRAEYQVGVL